jgi:hypothetical protein
MRGDTRLRFAFVSICISALGALAGCGGGGSSAPADGGRDTASSLPAVAFTTPAPGQNLCSAGSTFSTCVPDADMAMVGWQGSLAVHVTAGGMPVSGVAVTFSTGATTLGMPTLDANGNAQLAVTLADGAAVTITARTADVPGFGVGMATITVVVDTTVPTAAPTALTATLMDRRQTSFQLNWTAPPDSGQTVSGYQIRAAKVPIDATNFDASGTVVIPYTGTPAAPNAADGFLAKNLVIEIDYYFAVAATDAAGNRSPIAATAAATTGGRFQVVTLTGQTATDHLGYSIDGTADLGTATGRAFAKDGLSDLVVGNFNVVPPPATSKVEIFFGSAGVYAAAPSVTITGSVSGFGATVANAGDVDGDALDDIAISSPNDGAGKVFIFSRKNPTWTTTAGTWPAALSDTQANYVITADASYTGTFFGQTLTTARGFEGAAASDLVIGTPGYANTVGQILIVKGSATFASVTLPSATGTFVINGPATMDFLGLGAIDIGPFAGSTGSWLLASATGAGAVYGFQAAGLSATNNVGAATDSTIFTPVSQQYGAPLSLIGPLGAGGSATGVAAAALGFFVDVHIGTSATGPLQGPAGGAPAPAVRFVDTASGNSWGVLTLGSGLPGTTQGLTLVGGDMLGDLVMAGQAEAATNPIYIVSGADLASMTGMVNVTTAPKVARAAGYLPSPWGGYAGATIIPDADGDGYSDFAVGEFAATTAGRVVVFH